MNKENQNNLSPNPVQEWRKYALENGFKKAKTTKATQEDIDIVSQSIERQAKKNQSNSIRSVNKAKDFFVV